MESKKKIDESWKVPAYSSGLLGLCGKSKGSASRLCYHLYSRAETLREALELWATVKDIRHDYRRAFIKFPSHESDLSPL